MRSFACRSISTVSTTRHVAKELGQGDVLRQEVEAPRQPRMGSATNIDLAQVVQQDVEPKPPKTKTSQAAHKVCEGNALFSNLAKGSS